MPTFNPYAQPYVEQTVGRMITNLFNQHGVPLDYHLDPTFVESPEARVARITQEVISGQRTMVDVEKSIQGLAASAPPPAPTGGGEVVQGPSFLEQARLLFPFIPEELLKVFAAAWERFGDTNLALAAMRQDPLYDKFFPGNRRPDGSVRLTEAEYLSTVESYKRQLSQFGVPADTLLTTEKIASLISGEVSAQEFGQRLSAAFTGIVSNIDQVRQFYADNFGAGNLSDAAIFASVLDPSRNPLQFQQQIEQAQIGGEAAVRGFDIDLAEAQRLDSFGVDQIAARRLFGQAQAQLPRLNDLIQRFNDPDDEMTLGEFADAVVINDPDQLRQIGRLFAQSSSSFSPRGGVLSDRRGAFVGLLQR